MRLCVSYGMPKSFIEKTTGLGSTTMPLLVSGFVKNADASLLRR